MKEHEKKAYLIAQGCNAVDKYGVPEPETLAAMQEYSGQQNAELREQLADLERENNNYRLVYNSVVKNRDDLREMVKELEMQVSNLTEIINGINGCRKISLPWPEELEKRVNKLWEEL